MRRGGVSDSGVMLPMFVSAVLLGALITTLALSRSSSPDLAVVPGGSQGSTVNGSAAPDPQPEPEPVPDPQPEPEPEPVPEPQPESEPVPDPQPEPEPDPQPEPVPEPQPEPTLPIVPEAEEDSGADAPVMRTKADPFSVYLWEGLSSGPIEEPVVSGPTVTLPQLSLLPRADSSFLGASRPAPELEPALQSALSSTRSTATLKLRPGTVSLRGSTASALASGSTGVLVVQFISLPEGWDVVSADVLGLLSGPIAAASEGRRLSEAWLVQWDVPQPSCSPPLEGHEWPQAGNPGFLLRFSGGAGSEVRATGAGYSIVC